MGPNNSGQRRLTVEQLGILKEENLTRVDSLQTRFTAFFLLFFRELHRKLVKVLQQLEQAQVCRLKDELLSVLQMSSHHWLLLVGENVSPEGALWVRLARLFGVDGCEEFANRGHSRVKGIKLKVQSLVRLQLNGVLFRLQRQVQWILCLRGSSRQNPRKGIDTSQHGIERHLE